jgi:hypothetical protein
MLTLAAVTVPTGCQSFHLGKAVVFQSSFHGMPVYVKSKSIDKRVVDGHTISFHADLDPRFALLLKNYTDLDFKRFSSAECGSGSKLNPRFLTN